MNGRSRRVRENKTKDVEKHYRPNSEDTIYKFLCFQRCHKSLK